MKIFPLHPMSTMDRAKILINLMKQHQPVVSDKLNSIKPKSINRTSSLKQLLLSAKSQIYRGNI